MNRKKFEEELYRIVDQSQVQKKESLALHTTIHLGGPADYWVVPQTPEELKNLLILGALKKVDCYLLGNGSNVIFGDKGYRGMVIHVGEPLSYLMMMEEGDGTVTVKAGAGLSLGKLAAETAKAGLTGLEFAGGIPGTVGGALLMNAGAYGGEMADTVQCIQGLNQDCLYETWSKEDIGFSYRHSRMMEETFLILGAEFSLTKEDPAVCQEKIRAWNLERRNKQPLEWPSAGSAFKRPKDHYAGALIEEAGCKGLQRGDMQISEKHAGFLINRGNGTAKDAEELLLEVQKKVLEQRGILLEPEIRFVGEF